jgi:hypothetical protein
MKSQMGEIMTRRMLAAAIALGLSANYATAHAAGGDAKTPVRHHETRSAAHALNRHAHYRTSARRSSRNAAASGAPPFYALPPDVPVYHRPGYTYVPRQGIADEACNLPTSRCPNEYRDVQ